MRRHTQERITLAKLAVLVTATGDECGFEVHRAQVERHDVQVVIGVDEKPGARPLTRVRDRCEVRNDLRGFEEYRRDEHCGGAIVHAGGDPFGQGVHGCGGHLDDLERFFGETIELAPQAVEFAGRSSRVAAEYGAATPRAIA